MAVMKTQELAGLDLVTDGELMRIDPSHPETNGMVDHFVSQMDGIRKHFSLTDFERFRADPLHACKFPPSELATVSLNYFVAFNGG
jgi:5-methyltetrahydropteroyltriglutamate--homocysteine methyltransferase